jgi:hypothetical protein
MIKFKEFQNDTKLTEEMEDKISILLYLAENEDMINESYDMDNLTEAQEAMIVEGLNDWLSKVGMKLHKGDGIIDYVLQFSKGAGQLIMAAMKGDEKKVKGIAASFKKENYWIFYLNLIWQLCI